MFAAALITTALLQSSAWVVDDTTSAVDGRRSYLAGVEAREGVRNSIGIAQKPLLSVTCVEGRRAVAITWPAYLGSDAVVRWKFDDGQIQRRDLGTMANGRLVTLSGRDADRFMASLAAAQTVVVSIAGYSGQAEAVFDVSGADEQVAAAQAVCAQR